MTVSSLPPYTPLVARCAGAIERRANAYAATHSAFAKDLRAARSENRTAHQSQNTQVTQAQFGKKTFSLIEFLRRK